MVNKISCHLNSMMASIRRQYFNPKLSGSFSGASGFLKNRKFKNRKNVIEELNKLNPYSLYKPAPKIYPRRRIVVPFKDRQWASDLIDMQKYSKENRGYKFIILFVDCFSKTCFSFPAKNKKGTTLVRAFKKIIKSSGRKPQILQVDQGKEYLNKDFKAFLQKEGIRMFHTFSKLKAVIAERMIRTLRSRIERYFAHTGKHKYIDVLQQFTTSYNSTYHSSIKMAPRDVNKDNEDQVWLNLYSSLVEETMNKTLVPKFKINDQVRISREKLVFEKGYKNNWSEEIFSIIKVNNTRPITYPLQDGFGETISGGFLEPELQLYSRARENNTPKQSS